MHSVNVAELKNWLSKYLAFAKGGEEVVIRDHNLPVAKLVPFSAEGAEGVSAGCRWEAAPPPSAARCKGTFEDPNRQRFGKQSDPSRSRQQRSRTVKKTTAFWDASALVLLCVHEVASRHAQSHLKRFTSVV